jgi:hypothetical protein
VLLASVWAEEAIESQLNTGINKPKGLGPKINDSDPFDYARAEEAIESQLNTGINKPKGLGPKINDSDPFDWLNQGNEFVPNCPQPLLYI